MVYSAFIKIMKNNGNVMGNEEITSLPDISVRTGQKSRSCI